jgi:hypothetical protein
MSPACKLHLALGALLLILTSVGTTARAEHVRSGQNFPPPVVVSSPDCLSIYIQTTTESAPVLDSFSKPSAAVFSLSHDLDASGFVPATKVGEGFQTERRREDRDRVRLPFSVVAIPEPTTIVLLGSGLLALGGIMRRRKTGL